jgi:hypothetical protein
MARGDFNGGSNWHGRNFAHNNWNGNWDRHHHFHNRFFVGSPFFYGGYYTYNGYGNCAWLRRQATITGSPYWVGALSGLPVLLGSLDEFTLPGAPPAAAGLRSGHVFACQQQLPPEFEAANVVVAKGIDVPQSGKMP